MQIKNANTAAPACTPTTIQLHSTVDDEQETTVCANGHWFSRRCCIVSSAERKSRPAIAPYEHSRDSKLSKNNKRNMKDTTLQLAVQNNAIYNSLLLFQANMQDNTFCKVSIRIPGDSHQRHSPLMYCRTAAHCHRLTARLV